MIVRIITEGGKDAGLGHITRCIALYEGFEQAGLSALLVVNGDESVRSLLGDFDHVLCNWLNDSSALFSEISDADVVIIDSYMADRGVYEEISRRTAVGVYLDDAMRMDYPRGIVLNGAVSAEKMAYPPRRDVKYLLGARYAPLRKIFHVPRIRPVAKTVKSVMITVGGTDTGNITPRLVKAVTTHRPDLLKRVIVAKGFTNTSEIEKLQDEKTQLVYHPDTLQMKEVMLISDIAISACGQTLYELAAVGVPTVGISVADNQLRNAEGWTISGFLEYVGRRDCEHFEERLTQAIDQLELASVRSRRAQTGRSIVDGLGCCRVVKAITSAANSK